MDITKDQKKAIKLAIHCMKEVRQKRHAFNSNLFKQFHAESQEDHYKKYQEITNAISLLEEMI